jgi:hypothetical protein
MTCGAICRDRRTQDNKRKATAITIEIQRPELEALIHEPLFFPSKICGTASKSSMEMDPA